LFIARDIGGYLPQLDNVVIPSSLSNSPYVQDINQVASISSSISSTLGLQLRRWTTFIEDTVNSTFVQIASRPSTLIRDNNSSTSAIATLPRISSSRGNVGVYNFIVSNHNGINSRTLIENLKKYRNFFSEEENINEQIEVNFSDKELIDEYLDLCVYEPVTFGQGIKCEG
jgi:hypothetical protein